MTAPFADGTTLDRFLLDTMRQHPSASGQFVSLMQSIALAATNGRCFVATQAARASSSASGRSSSTRHGTGPGGTASSCR